MSQTTQHTIRKQILEVQFQEEVSGAAVQESLKELYYSVIVPELQRAFDRFAPGDTVIWLDRLSLDFGELDPRASEEELRAKIARKLELEFAELQLKKEQGEEGIVVEETPTVTSMDELERYLKTGRRLFPAHRQEEGLEELLGRLLNHETPNLVETLRRVGKSRPARMRLARIRNPELKINLARALQPAWAGDLLRRHRDLRKLVENLARKGDAPQWLLPLLDEALFEILLQPHLTPQASLSRIWVRLALGRNPNVKRLQPKLKFSLEQLALENKFQGPEALRKELEEAFEKLSDMPEEGSKGSKSSGSKGKGGSKEESNSHSPSQNSKNDFGSQEKGRISIPWKLEPETEAEVYINCAGLILLWPFFYHLFDYFKMLKEGEFKNPEAQERAVMMLHYLATGKTEGEEEALILNKILCGLDMEEVVTPYIDLSEDERAELDKLIEVAIERWGKIGSMSVDGFRGSFLVREGRIEKKFGQSGWNLHVERETYDALLEGLPWNLSTVRTRLMKEAIYVEW